MSENVIEVEGLGKRYRIGAPQERYRTLREHIVKGTKAIGRRVQNLFGETAGELPERDVWALRDVSFTVKSGEVLGVIGRNGAGKTTLLKILSRITEPTTGVARIRGRVGSLLEVGTGFHPELTGRENVYLNGAILGMRRAEIDRKFDEIVAFAEVQKFIDTQVKHYSSGMYVRLAFAVAAHMEPAILVIDEVLAVGDAKFQQRCLGKMSEISQEGRTVLFVSHNLSAIRSLCRVGLLLDSGAVAAQGEIESVINAYSVSPLATERMAWDRPVENQPKTIGFVRICVSLGGVQPCLKLNCDAVIESRNGQGKWMIAVDICDSMLVPIMQAMPEHRPTLGGEPGRHLVHMEIDLPPLIPGRYCADFWIGHDYNCTRDYLKNVVSFDVLDSPAIGRTHPHSASHGLIVPTCRYTQTQISQ